MRQMVWLAILVTGTLGTQRASAQSPATFAGKPAFTQITTESGIARLIEDKYQKDPNWWLSGLYLIDLDGDGNLDFVTGAHGGGGPIAALGDGAGHFRLAPEFTGTEVHIACDINEDGKLDLQMTHGDGGGKWWINESTPGRVRFRDSGITASQARQNAMIDIDRDGKVDWLHERPGVVWELGDGKGGFKPSGGIPTGAKRNETNIHYADLRGNGRIDLIVHWGRYDHPAGQSRVFFNDGKLGFSDVTKQIGLSPQDGFAIKGVGDVNHDGFPDLMALENKWPEVYLNDGKSNFKKRQGALIGMQEARKPPYVSWGLATVVDLDNDGIADILWNGRNFLWVLRGNGDGTFTYMNKAWGIDDYSKATVDEGLCFGDIDGDGALDLIGFAADREPARVKVYRNDLPKQNWLNIRPVGAPGNRAAAGATIRITDPSAGARLLWCEQVQIVASQSAHSYYAHVQTERHFGLGARAVLDASVEFYPSRKTITMKRCRANRTVVFDEGTGRTAEISAALGENGVDADRRLLAGRVIRGERDFHRLAAGLHIPPATSQPQRD